MRFLANENFPLDAVEALRQQEHDVVWIRTESPGVSDSEVLSRAQADDRILLTFDKDFAVTLRDDWAGHFSVVEDDKVRMRLL